MGAGPPTGLKGQPPLGDAEVLCKKQVVKEGKERRKEGRMDGQRGRWGNEWPGGWV